MNAHTANEVFARTVRSERKITCELLKMILKFEDHKFHLALGYSSLFEWLTKGHGYDEGSANRRIQAARAMRVVPEVEQKLQEGKTTMTNLVKAQAIFRSTGGLSADQKREVIESIEGQTTAEATQTLFKMFPEAASQINQDRRSVINEEFVRYAFNLSNEQEQPVLRARELLSHTIPDGSMADIVEFLARFFVERTDPLRKHSDPPCKQAKIADKTKSSARNDRERSQTLAVPSTAVASKQRVSAKLRSQVIQDAEGQCEFVDPHSGRRCESRVRPEVDHIQMRAFGGSNARANLRCLCRAHNQFMSEKKLGKVRANKWRNSRTDN